MARLEILSPSGKVRETTLPAGAALSVGRHATCDIRINADGVNPVHCRFLPDGDGYRVAAGPDGGLRINGSEVAEKRLAEGDSMTVGPAKLTFRADPPAGSGEESEELALVAASSDALPTWADPARAKAAEKDRARRTPAGPPKGESAKGPLKKAKPATAANDAVAVSPAAAAAIFEEVDEDEEPADGGFDDDDGGLDVLAELAADETGERPVADATEDDDEIFEAVPGSDGEAAAKPVPAEKPAADGPDAGEQPVLLPAGGAFAPLTKLAGPPRRPGEESVFKSPLVLGLSAAAAALVLAAFTFFFLTQRERAERLYQAADEDRRGGKYAAALQRFDELLIEYPADALTPAVRQERGLTKIEQAVDGSGGDWAEGVAALDEFVRDNRDLETFEATHPELAALARRAALGAAEQAKRGGPRELLAVVEEAGTRHRRYADPEAARTADQTREIAAALRTATAAVVKRETFADTRAKVAAALEKNDFSAAHRARENLVARYGDLAADRDVRALKAETLDAEADAVTEIPAAGPPPAPADPPPALVPAVVSRAQTGEGSDGRFETVRAGPSLFAVDAVTAEPLWRASVGAGGIAPFEPAVADAGGQAVLICDAVRPALLSVVLETGEVSWRLPLPAAATGPPRRFGGQALVGCEDGSLLAVDPTDGTVLGGLKFPQAVLSPPVPAGRPGAGGGLLLAGRKDTLYTLSTSPLALEAVSYAGHGGGAVNLPLAPLELEEIGRLVMMCDNDRADAALLRAFEVDPDTGAAAEVGRARVTGRIDVPPTLWADKLFVSSSPERMTAYAVTDAAGEEVFERLAAAQLPDPKPVPTFLAAGQDGTLWAAGAALRKLELTGDGLKLTPAVLAAGRHVAPPQSGAGQLFTTRLTPAGTATIFAAADADAMVGVSRTVLAPRLLAVTGGDRPAALSATGVLTPLGDGFDGGVSFLTNGRTLPGLDGDGRDPLLVRPLPDGGAVAAVGGEQPRAWEIDADGRAGRPVDLPAAPDIPPLPLGPGLLVAAGPRLELVVGRGGRGVSAFTAPIEGGDAPAWIAAAALSDTRAVVTDAAGTVRLIDYSGGSSSSLSEAAAVAPGWFADVAPAVAGDAVLIAGSDGTLHRLGGSNLSENASAALPSRAAFAPAVVGGRVLVALADGTVAGFDADTLGNPAVTPMPDPAAGPPAALGDGAAGVATVGGAVVRFDPATGAVTGVADTGQPLAGPLFELFGGSAAAAADGAVVKLTFERPDAGEGEE